MIVATKNRRKFNKIKQLFRQFYPHLAPQPLPAKIESPEETGKSEQENACLKANYYYEKLKSDVLVSDEGIYFDGVSVEDQPGYLIHRQSLEYSNSLLFWNHYIQRQKIKSGKIVKVLVFKSESCLKLSKVIIPVKFVCYHGEQPKEDSLNSLMIPRGFNVPFVEMDQTQVKKFNKIYLRKPLTKILRLTE